MELLFLGLEGSEKYFHGLASSRAILHDLTELGNIIDVAISIDMIDQALKLGIGDGECNDPVDIAYTDNT